MTASIGFVDDTVQSAHTALIAHIRTLALANGWTVLRYDTTALHELILKAPGYTGNDPCFIGFKSYQDIGADYYNMTVGVFTGFVSGNSFETQPGAMLSGVPLHNRRIDYWMVISPQRIAAVLKVGTPVYEHFYAGKMLPYARPSQYPYPVVCGGMLIGSSDTRFSENTHTMPYRGGNARLQLKTNAGGAINPAVYPFNSSLNGTLRDTLGNYPLMPLELWGPSDVFGVLEGVFYISGFDNVVENTTTVSGMNYLVAQDVWRTNHGDYIALRLN